MDPLRVICAVIVSIWLSSAAIGQVDECNGWQIPDHLSVYANSSPIHIDRFPIVVLESSGLDYDDRQLITLSTTGLSFAVAENSGNQLAIDLHRISNLDGQTRTSALGELRRFWRNRLGERRELTQISGTEYVCEGMDCLEFIGGRLAVTDAYYFTDNSGCIEIARYDFILSSYSFDFISNAFFRTTAEEYNRIPIEGLELPAQVGLRVICGSNDGLAIPLGQSQQFRFVDLYYDPDDQSFMLTCSRRLSDRSETVRMFLFSGRGMDRAATIYEQNQLALERIRQQFVSEVERLLEPYPELPSLPDLQR